jgi:mono/diheme cytochrome c family protein
VDLWAAVRSVPAVAGDVPPHDLAPPYNLRSGLAAWKRLFFDPGPLSPVPGRSDAWNRGRYLAEGPAHCAACHAPRNVAGALASERLSGGDGPGDETVPPITPEALADGGWTADDLVYALRTGITPSGDLFGGSMAEVVRDGTRYWTDADLTAIVEYLLNPRREG